MSDDWSFLNSLPLARSQTLSTDLSTIESKVDFVWHNSQLNQLAWNRKSTNSQQFDPPKTELASAGWQVIATGDLDQDQQMDLLWRHSSGFVLWWVMESAVKSRRAVVLPAVSDPNWQAVGTGDSNGDGQLDILWRNVVNGVNLWWEMGSYQPNVSTLNPQSFRLVRSVTTPDWLAGGIGDINHDGISDIFWYHRPSGTGQWWLMDKSGSPNLGILQTTTPIPTNYDIRGITDLNDDGQLDFLFQDQLGNVHQWLMRSPSSSGTIDVLARTTVSAGMTGSGWKIVGASNLNSFRAASSMEIDAGNSLVNATFKPSGVFTSSQSIGGDDLTDTYLFGLGGRGIFTASLSGLSADADLKLIWDKNGNAQIDSGDELTWQWERGVGGDSLRKLLEPGGYYLEVSSYDGKLTNYTLQTGFQPLGANAIDPLKFDIQIEYGRGADRLTPATRSVIDSAALFWEKVIPYRTNDSLLPDGPLKITISTEDLNLKDGSPDLLTLAFAGPQVVSNGARLRLQSGTATINSRRLGTLDTNELQALLIHEFSHVLGFGTLWDPLDFRATDGSIVKIGTRADQGSFIDRTRSVYRADSYAGWAYGDLLKAAGRANTVVPTAVPIEAQFFAHWSEAVFQNESLTPIAPITGSVAPVSQLTLAALKDLGWAVDFGMAQSYQLPPPASTAANVDFSNLAWGGAKSVQMPVESSGYRPVESSGHRQGCGCQHHLANSRTGLTVLGHSLESAVGLG